MNEQEVAKAQEKASSYMHMMESWAWKDFWNYVKSLRQEALERGMGGNTNIDIERGRVKNIDDIEGELAIILGAIGK